MASDLPLIDKKDAASDEHPPMQPLGEYTWPSMPAEETARRIFARIYTMFRSHDDAPFIAQDKLRQVTLEKLDEVVAPPACGPVLDELDTMVSEWMADDDAPHVKLVVIPPCDRNGIIDIFARENGLEILPEPDRMSLRGPVETQIPLLDGTGMLVIPDLEKWFLRHRNGLITVRRLLAILHEGKRRCLIGCNSWAWAFLKKSVQAELLLPDAITFAPFDARRLQNWFSELATSRSTGQIQFRLSKNGKDVFEGDDPDGQPNDYFRTLSAHSLGIPWVAWHMWRRSLFSSIPDDAKDKNDPIDPDTETLWVGALDEIIIPGKHPQTALLVLHAILIHDTLTAETIAEVVPIVGESNVLSSLVTSGFVQRHDDLISIRPAAYPAVRSALSDAGFPMDTL